jgi:hypothetical protein
MLRTRKFGLTAFSNDGEKVFLTGSLFLKEKSRDFGQKNGALPA